MDWYSPLFCISRSEGVMGEPLASAGVRSVLEGGRGVGDDGELLDLTFGHLQYDPFVLP